MIFILNVVKNMLYNFYTVCVFHGLLKCFKKKATLNLALKLHTKKSIRLKATLKTHCIQFCIIK